MGRPARCGTVALGPCLFAFGGEDDDATGPGHTTMYNMATRRMGEGAKPPRALRGCTGVACGGLVYSLGGWVYGPQHVADVFIYNPDIDSWVGGPTLPLAVDVMAAVEHMGCVYACGGWKGDDPPSDSLLMLDPRTRTWASLPDMPTPVKYAQASVVADRMYVPGGGAGAALEPWALPILQCYDLVAGRWDMNCAPMAWARSAHGVAALHGEVWAVGGKDDDVNYMASVEVYSPRLNTWRSGVSLPREWCHGACAVVQC